jgi:hypothetical protein
MTEDTEERMEHRETDRRKQTDKDRMIRETVEKETINGINNETN